MPVTDNARTLNVARLSARRRRAKRGVIGDARQQNTWPAAAASPSAIVAPPALPSQQVRVSAAKSRKKARARRAARFAAAQKQQQQQQQQKPPSQQSQQLEELAAQAAVDALEMAHKQQDVLRHAGAFSEQVRLSAEHARKLARVVTTRATQAAQAADGGHGARGAARKLHEARHRAEVNEMLASSAVEAARSVLRLQAAVHEAQATLVDAVAKFAHRHSEATHMKREDDDGSVPTTESMAAPGCFGDGEEGEWDIEERVPASAGTSVGVGDIDDEEAFYEHWARFGGHAMPADGDDE